MAICDTAALRSNGGFGSSPGGCGEKSARLSPFGPAPARPARIDFEPADRVDERAPVAVSRRIVALENPGDGFKGARGLGFGAREPHFKALDHGIERGRDCGRAGLSCGRISARDALEAFKRRIEPIVFSFAGGRRRAGVGPRIVGDRLVKPIVKPHAGAAGGLQGGVAAARRRSRPV